MLGGEERHDLRNLLRSSKPLNWKVFVEVFLLFLVVKGGVIAPLRVDDSRGHRADNDPILRELLAHRPDVAVQSRLGRGKGAVAAASPRSIRR